MSVPWRNSLLQSLDNNSKVPYSKVCSSDYMLCALFVRHIYANMCFPGDTHTCLLHSSSNWLLSSPMESQQIALWSTVALKAIAREFCLSPTPGPFTFSYPSVSFPPVFLCLNWGSDIPTKDDNGLAACQPLNGQSCSAKKNFSGSTPFCRCSRPLWEASDLKSNVHRTRKMEDFQKQPWAEICWYFTETREQYRLTGKLSVIDKNAEDKAQRVCITAKY